MENRLIMGFMGIVIYEWNKCGQVMNEQQDIDKFVRLAEKNMPNQSYERAKETARTFALRYNAPYVVIKGSGWQVWSKEMCEKLGREWVYCAEVSE